MVVLIKSIIKKCLFVLIVVKCVACNFRSVKPNAEYGKKYYDGNCSFCHSKTHTMNEIPSLLELNAYDSMTLINKLKGVAKDSLHKKILSERKYSIEEVIAIRAFIKATFSPRY